MSISEKKILSDPTIEPTQEFIYDFLGNKKVWWQSIMDSTMKNYPNVTPVWKYYNDGKQWLFRLLQKKKTIFWLSLFEDTFRITFYFTDKAEPLLEESTIPREVLEQFRSGKYFNKIRGITIKISKDQDVETVLKLVAVRLQVL